MANTSKAESVNMVIRGRLSFVNVFKPRPSMNPGGDPKYSVCIMIPKKDPQVKAIQEVISKLANEEWGPGSAKKLGSTYKTILRDGAEQEEEYPEFKGMMFLNASSTMKPGVIDYDRNELHHPEDCYSGVDAQVAVNFFTYNNVSKGISAGLNHVRVINKLPPLSGRGEAKDVEWGEVPRPEGEETGGDEMLS